MEIEKWSELDKQLIYSGRGLCLVHHATTYVTTEVTTDKIMASKTSLSAASAGTARSKNPITNAVMSAAAVAVVTFFSVG